MALPKPVIALVHGWGMNPRVFDALAMRMEPTFDVRIPSLPGHAGRALLPNNSLQHWAADLIGQLPAHSTLLGWSLGGQVAMRAALDYPDTIARLIVVASTPKFVTSEGWALGMALSDLQAFGAALQNDPEATLMRFMGLQTRGVADQKTLLLQLREAMSACPPATPDALLQGLALLLDTDLRTELPRLVQPTLVLHGALDTLTPRSAGKWLADTLPNARHVEFERAAHAPHLSHAEAVATAIERFVDD